MKSPRRTFPTDIIPLAQAAHDAQLILVDDKLTDQQKVRKLKLLYVEASLNGMLDRILPEQRKG